tara:strand:+ start:282 stop:467 length:186 start_codon:yes stop_codon:yes gene_type:complete
MTDVVWSINIMCAILLVLVGISIYWIFKYDEWYPNPVVHNDIPIESEHNDTGVQELGIGEE